MHIKQHFDKSSKRPPERIVVGCFPLAAVDSEFDQAEVALHFFQHIFVGLGNHGWIIMEGSTAKGSEHDGIHSLARRDGQDVPGAVLMQGEQLLR